MKKKLQPFNLGRRERQVLETVYALEKGSVWDVLNALPDPPSYSAVRAILNNLADKGHLKRQKAGHKFLYLPTASHEEVGRSAMRRMLDTFFSGSASRAMASLLEMDRESLSPEELDELAGLIEKARQEGR